jgi:hypothetical protein
MQREEMPRQPRPNLPRMLTTATPRGGGKAGQEDLLRAVEEESRSLWLTEYRLQQILYTGRGWIQSILSPCAVSQCPEVQSSPVLLRWKGGRRVRNKH